MQVPQRPAPPAAHADPAPRRLAAVAAWWVLAGALPQVIVVAAILAYVTANGLSITNPTFAQLAKLPHVGMAVIAAVAFHVVATGCLRGLALRRVVPNFPIVLSCIATVPYAVAILAFTAAAASVGLLMAKVVVLPDAKIPPAPAGPELYAMLLGWVIAGELFGVILAGIPGLLLAALEALVLRVRARGMGGWIMWGAAAWSSLVAVIFLSAFPAWADRSLPSAALGAIAVATPILIGVVFALFTLPAVARLKPR